MKRIFPIIFGLVYMVCVFFCLVIQIKPGAKIFYMKSRIQTQDLIRDGNGFEYQFKINLQFFDPNSILVIEDQKILSSDYVDNINPRGNGTFALKQIGNDYVTILFIPSNYSDSAAHEPTYSIYIRPYLFTRTSGGIGLLLLSLGLIAFFWSIMVVPTKRKLLFGSPLGIVKLWINLFGEIENNFRSLIRARIELIKHSIVNLVLIVFFYVFMEWVFYITKPSFMDIYDLDVKIYIFLITGLAAALFSFLAITVVFLVDFVLTPFFPSVHKYAYHLPFAFLAASLCLILIDNFTYTLFKFGIVYSTSIGRVLYALGFIGIMIYILRKMTEPLTLTRRCYRIKVITSIPLITFSLISAIFAFNPVNTEINLDGKNSNIIKKPNIILLGTDGLNAESMSAYGYDRETTPFISELVKTSLISENNFTNAANSMGSGTSILTGKLPFVTRVEYPPDTLKGNNMYQHLPGLLKSNGYRTVSLGVPYYVDANTINFKNAFDAVNCIDNPPEFFFNRLTEFGYGDEIYFLNIMVGRIGDRLSHILFIKDMQNPYELVTQQKSHLVSLSDTKRLNCLRSDLNEVRQTGQPLFAHIHLMGTHGNRFTPSAQVFSVGKSQDHDWMVDFYDDAILSFDTEVYNIVQDLKDDDLYDNTILILYSDHGQKPNTTLKRIPLIIHFPKDQYAGVITNNTQNVDISPTILDYMGIPKPGWMNGNSLLGTLDPKRLILAGLPIGLAKGALPLINIKPPFYQFGQISVIQCQNWYDINLQNATINEGNVAGYFKPCAPAILDTADQIKEEVGKVLIESGYTLPDYW